MAQQANEPPAMYVEGQREMGQIEEIWESYGGDLWIITEVESDRIGFGYARLAAMPQFAEWGSINRKELVDNPKIWTVDRPNWQNVNTYDGVSVIEEEG